MGKINRLVSAVALVSLGLLAGVAPTAHAASNCPSTGNLACYYDGANYASTRNVIPDAGFSGDCYLGPLTAYWASSLYNNSVNTQIWYTNADWTGSSISVNRQSGKATLSATFNNNIKSWKGTCYGGTRIAG